jgi:hypothetical protein
MTTAPAHSHTAMYNDIVNQQKALCERLGLEWVESPPYLKVGVAKNVREGAKPVNGLRHYEEGDTTGWYIWAGGEIPQVDPDFFPLFMLNTLLNGALKCLNTSAFLQDGDFSLTIRDMRIFGRTRVY